MALSSCARVDPTRDLYRITGWAIDHECIDLSGLSVSQPSLEDVYLELTGEEADVVSVRRTLSLLWGQIKYQNKIFFRNPMAAFFTLFFPLMIFVVFSLMFGNQEIEYLGVTTAQYYAPSMAVFAAVSATYTNLAVTTAYQRDQGILKRDARRAPLPAVCVHGRQDHLGDHDRDYLCGDHDDHRCCFSTECKSMQPRCHRRSQHSRVGVATFASLGLLVAAVVRSGEAATAVANATLLPLAFFSGVFIVPSADSPAWLDAVANFFPLEALSSTPFVAAFNPQTVGGADGTGHLLRTWRCGALLSVALAIRWFKWEPACSVMAAGRRRKEGFGGGMNGFVIRRADRGTTFQQMNTIYNEYIVDSHVSFDLEPWNDREASRLVQGSSLTPDTRYLVACERG